MNMQYNQYDMQSEGHYDYLSDPVEQYDDGSYEQDPGYLSDELCAYMRFLLLTSCFITNGLQSTLLHLLQRFEGQHLVHPGTDLSLCYHLQDALKLCQ